jgi:hypothetical protein
MANPDFDALLNALYSMAQQLLAKNDELYPFGVTMDKKGDIAYAAGESESEQPLSNDVIDMLEGGFRSRAKSGEIRAAGICLDVRVIPPNQTEKSDALCARMEHENGEAIEACLPYRKNENGCLEYGDVFAYKADCRIFG